jgi:predicted neutral ceramidase superfamily lipid hydrolase
METLLHNESVIYIAMVITVFLLTNVLKMPIKVLTGKIKTEKIRKRVNTIIFVLPFILGIALDIFYCIYYLHTEFSIIRGLGYGTSAIALYHGIEQNFKIKTDNPYNTEQGKKAVELVNKITEDGKIDENDMSAVKEFWDAVK